MPETCGLVAALVGQASMFVPQSAEAAAALGDAREAARGSAEAAQGSGTARAWSIARNAGKRLIESVTTGTAVEAPGTTEAPGAVRISYLAVDVDGSRDHDVAARKYGQRLVGRITRKSDRNAGRYVDCGEIEDTTVRHGYRLGCGRCKRSVSACRTTVKGVLCANVHRHREQ
jgi:hypothetical protein